MNYTVQATVGMCQKYVDDVLTANGYKVKRYPTATQTMLEYEKDGKCIVFDAPAAIKILYWTTRSGNGHCAIYDEEKGGKVFDSNKPSGWNNVYECENYLRNYDLKRCGAVILKDREKYDIIDNISRRNTTMEIIKAGEFYAVIDTTKKEIWNINYEEAKQLSYLFYKKEIEKSSYNELRIYGDKDSLAETLSGMRFGNSSMLAHHAFNDELK